MLGLRAARDEEACQIDWLSWAESGINQAMLRRFFMREPDPSALLVTHQGRDFPVVLRRSAQAKRLTLRVNHAKRELVLTLPERARLSDAQAFATRYSGWIAERMRALPPAVSLQPGGMVPLRGVDHHLVHRPDKRGTVWLEEGENGPEIHVAGKPEFFTRRLLDFLKSEAKKDLTEASLRHAASLDVTISRISLRDTTSRWGSCSSTGAISYSWRMIFAPPSVLDYLCAHEVAHRREMNHSARFWALTRQLCPQMDSAKAWLKRHGSALHQIG